MKSCTISRHAQGLLTAFFAVLILSLDTLLTRKLGNVPNFVVIFYKNFLFAMPMMLYLLVTSGVQGTIDKFRHIGPYGWFAGLVWGTSNLLITYGFQIIEVATVLVIVAANPMFAAIFSYLILKEPVPWYTMLAGLVCFGAIVVIFYSELTSSNSPNVGGLLAALGSAITMGLYFVLLRFIDARSERPSGTLDPMPCNVIAGLFAAIVALIVEPEQNIPNSMSGLYLFLDGVIVLGISFTMLNWCPSMISATEVSLMMLIETGVGPVFVFLGGYESPPSSAVYGGCALAAALILHSYVAVQYEMAATTKDSSAETSAKSDEESSRKDMLEMKATHHGDSEMLAVEDSADLHQHETKEFDETLFSQTPNDDSLV